MVHSTTPWLGRLLSFLASLFLAFAPSSAPAQAGFKHPVEAKAAISAAEVRRGETVRLAVTVDVKDEYHIYAIYLTGKGPLPTTLDEIDLPAWLEPQGDWTEPKPVVKFDEGFETNIEIHEAYPVVFERTYLVKPDAPTGEQKLKVRMTTVACRERNCLPPKKITMEVALKIAEGAAVATPAATPAPSPTPKPTATPATAATVKNDPSVAPPATGAETEQKTFFGFIAFCFGAGLVSLVTPCVFPMIPITISFFTKRASTTRGGAIRLAYMYGGTIIAAFGLFGFVLSVALRMLGAGSAAAGIVNQIAANPWVNLALTGIFVAFAFSLFGMFDLSLPGWITDRLQNMKGNRTDTVGAMFMALIFVVVSFTCTAPIVGTLMIAALGGEWLRPFFGFLAYATGFALPFFLLALVPSMLTSLPKSGGWLNSVKVVMGLLELAAAMKFISNSDLIWRWGFFTREVVLSSWVAISAAVTLYLLRKIRLPHDDESTSISPVRLSWALSFGTLALVLAAGLAGSRLPQFVEAYLPPDLNPHATVASGSGKTEELSWLMEFDAGVAEAAKSGKPIFIDFTGYTCTNCRFMEKNVFPDRAVHELLGEYVRVQLWTDDAEVGERHQAFQAERFGTIALPTYVTVSPDGATTYGMSGYTSDPREFEAFLRAGLESAKSTRTTAKL